MNTYINDIPNLSGSGRVLVSFGGCGRIFSCGNSKADDT